MTETPAVQIQIDRAESRSEIPRLLGGMADVRTELVSLDIGDYALSDRVVVERKAASDFVLSICDGRLTSQAVALAAAYAQPVLVVEGNLAAVMSGINPESVRGALSYVALVLGISVLPTASPAETAALLRRMAIHAQHGLGYEVPMRVGKPSSPALAAQYLVEGLPGVGPGRARALLAHFGTPRALFAADLPSLVRVPGIGKAAAAKILAALEADGRA